MFGKDQGRKPAKQISTMVFLYKGGKRGTAQGQDAGISEDWKMSIVPRAVWETGGEHMEVLGARLYGDVATQF